MHSGNFVSRKEREHIQSEEQEKKGLGLIGHISLTSYRMSHSSHQLYGATLLVVTDLPKKRKEGSTVYIWNVHRYMTY